MFLKILVFRKAYVCFYPSVCSQVFTKLEPPSRVSANLIFTPHVSPQTGRHHWYLTKWCYIKAKLSQVWKVPVTPGIASSRPKWRWAFPPKEKIAPQSDTLEISRPWTGKERFSLVPCLVPAWGFPEVSVWRFLLRKVGRLSWLCFTRNLKYGHV